MKLDNPFFTREVRQHAGRPTPLQLGILATCVILGFFLLLLHYFHVRYAPRHPVPYAQGVLWLLVLPHTGLCMLAAAHATDRIFGDEHRRGTLEGVLLLPYRPSWWLLLRLVHPLYLTFSAWLLGAPLYLLLGVVGLVPPELTFRTSLAAPLLALLVIPAMLLLPPDYRERMRRNQGLLRRQINHDTDLKLWWFSTVGAGMLCLNAFWRVLTSDARPIPVLHTTVPVWLIGLATTGVFIACAGAMSLTVLSTNETALRQARRVRVVGAVALYYAMILVVWLPLLRRLPWWFGLGFMLMPAITFAPELRQQFQRLRRHPEQGTSKSRENRWGREEARWAAQRWPNPIFTRDLTSYLQGTSLRLLMLLEVVIIAAILLGLAYVTLRSGGSLADLASNVAGFTLFLGPVLLLTEMCARPYALWTRERAAGTLPLLFLTPLSSEQILRGRIQASVTYALLVHTPLLLLLAISVGWAIAHGWWVLVPGIIIFSPLAALFVVVLACTVQPQTLAPWHWHPEDWFEAGLSIVQLALLFFQTVKLFELQPDRSMPELILLTLLMCGLNATITFICFRLRLRQFELFRSGERHIRER